MFQGSYHNSLCHSLTHLLTSLRHTIFLNNSKLKKIDTSNFLSIHSRGHFDKMIFKVVIDNFKGHFRSHFLWGQSRYYLLLWRLFDSLRLMLSEIDPSFVDFAPPRGSCYTKNHSIILNACHIKTYYH